MQETKVAAMSPPRLLRFVAVLMLVTTRSLAFDIRIMNNTAPNFGTVEFRENSTSPWGYVCYNHVTVEAATLMCQYMGYDVDTAVVVKVFEDDVVNESALVSYVNCSESATSITQCNITFGGADRACDPEESISIDCNAPPPANKGRWRFRVVSSTNTSALSNRGLLEMRPNRTSPWGTVCNAGFNQDDALAACHSSGYNVSVAFALNFVVGGTGPVYLSDVMCNTSTYYIQNCTSTFMFNSCTHDNDVGVDCSGIIPSDPGEIVVYTATFFTNTTTASQVTSSISSRFHFPSWRVDTLDVGVPLADGTQNVTFEILDAPLWDFYNEPKRTDIDYFLLNMNAESLLAMFQIVFMVDNSTLHHRPSSMLFRLEGGNETYGRLGVFPAGEAGWGTICSDYFTDVAAMAACHSLGFYNATAAFVLFDFGGGNGTIYMSSVECSGSDYYLQNCTYDYFDPLAPITTCTHDYDVGVQCILATPPPPSTTTTTTTTTTAVPTTTTTSTTAVPTTTTTTTTTAVPTTTTTTTAVPTTSTTTTTTTTAVPTTTTTTTTTAAPTTTTTTTAAPTTTTTTTSTTAVPTTTTTTTTAVPTSTTTSTTTTAVPTTTTTTTAAPTTTSTTTTTTTVPPSTTTTTTAAPPTTTTSAPTTTQSPATTTTTAAPTTAVPTPAPTTSSSTFLATLQPTTTVAQFTSNLYLLMGISQTSTNTFIVVTPTNGNAVSFFFATTGDAILTASALAIQLAEQYQASSAFTLTTLGAAALEVPNGVLSGGDSAPIKGWMWGVAGGVVGLFGIGFVAYRMKTRGRSDVWGSDNFIPMNEAEAT